MGTATGQKIPLKEGVQAALDAVREGRTEEAGLLLYRCAYNLILRRLVTGNGTRVVGMSEADAEDNIYPVIQRFVSSKPNGSAGGLSWLYLTIDSTALDFHRRAAAQKRGGDLQFEAMYTEDGDLNPLVDKAESLFGSSDVNPGLDDCMERATQAFEKDFPAYGRVLRLVKEGLDNDELAIAYGANPENITEAQRKNIRQRKSHALKQARDYFEPCKD